MTDDRDDLNARVAHLEQEVERLAALAGPVKFRSTGAVRTAELAQGIGQAIAVAGERIARSGAVNPLTRLT